MRRCVKVHTSQGVFSMKRKFFSWAGGLAVLLVSSIVAGCMTQTPIDAGRYDSSSPESNDSILIIGTAKSLEGITMVTEFDGQTVSWVGEEGLLGGDPRAFTIRIPAGQHTLTGGPVMKQQGTNALKYSTSTKFNFVAGKAYNVDVISRNFKIQEVKF
jgi:hypothetical protein